MPHSCIIPIITLIRLPFIFIAMAFISNPSSLEDNTSGTDLSNICTEDEEHIDISKWMPIKWKKLQHMVDFHKEYQCIFGEKASLHTIMKNRITHMNPLCLTLYARRKCKVQQQRMML